jgi:hypothetical protein
MLFRWMIIVSTLGCFLIPVLKNHPKHGQQIMSYNITTSINGFGWLWLEMTSQRTHGWETQILDAIYIHIYMHICMHLFHHKKGLVWQSGTPKSNGLSLGVSVLFHFWVASIFRHPHIIFLADFLAVFYQKYLKIASHKDPYFFDAPFTVVGCIPVRCWEWVRTGPGQDLSASTIFRRST